MEKAYEPKQFEKRIYQEWEAAGYFRPSGHGAPFCIMLPPPNVTGTLHMGHGFQNALIDALIRYHRMCGDNTLWQPGTDHAGISTQMVVERQLLMQNISRHDLGREKFLEKVWAWKDESGDQILNQMRTLGSSPNWDSLRFTMDEKLSEAVHKVFNQLYDEGLIYRGKRLVNWDPKLQTAISDLEVINTDEQGSLWHFRYPLADNSGYIVIATTRPETMLGDTAVAVHPEDERYQSLIGKMIKLPLTDREIPIIADEYVDPAFGTGCVKITPAHDFNDAEVGKRHELPIINILNLDATLNENTPEPYRAKDRLIAREMVVDALKKLNLIEKIEPYAIKVPRGDRSHEIIEPLLTDQWFVKIDPLAKPAIDAVESGKIKFVPDNWKNTYFQWMNNIQDWCISRQLWWGHRIPAWYDDAGNVYVGIDEHHVREKYQLDESLSLKQDDDVLDTWFSSALWPFSTLGWPEQTPELKMFYPTSALVTGFDIIFFWVARMIMFGLKFTGEVPFHEVYIHGLIRDQEGQKMSKTKGNVIDPLDLIHGIELKTLIQKRTYGLMQPEMKERIIKSTTEHFPEGIKAYGTDAVRFTYCSLANPGRDIRFDMSRLEGYRNFCNKLWNATRFVLMQFDQNEKLDLSFNATQPINQWIVSKLNRTTELAHQHFEQYRFDLLAQTLYDFTWHEFCDWYLELTKPILTGDDETAKQETKTVLITVLDALLKLLHPIIPFVTESLWQEVKQQINVSGNSIMIQPYPVFNKALLNETAENDISWLQSMILAIRNLRGEMNIPPSKTIELWLKKGSTDDHKHIEQYQTYLSKLAKIDTFKWLKDDAGTANTATAICQSLELYLPLAGLIDVEAEKARLQKEIDKLSKELLKAEQKLNNKNFTDKAPPAVVEQEKEREAQFKLALGKLQSQYDSL